MEKIFSYRKRESSFVHYVGLSFVSHILVFILICLFYNLSSVSAKKAPSSDLKAFARALGEVENEMFSGDSITEQFPLKDIPHEEIFKKFKEIKVPKLKLNEKQKIEIYKKMIKAFLALVDSEKRAQNPELTSKNILDLFKDQDHVQLDSGGKIFNSRIYSENKKEFVFAPPKKISFLERLRKFEDREKKWTRIRGGRVEVQTEEGVKFIPQPYYFRESPYEQILAQGASLFFIFRGFPQIDPASSFKEKSGENQDDDFVKGLSPDFQVVYLYESVSSPSQTLWEPKKQKEPLTLSKGKINQLLDQWMEFSEEEQFDNFRQSYLERYHPDSGDLAELLREFVYKNQSNVIIVIDEISGAFAFIEELYFNKPMDTYLPTFWSKHRKTQAGMECLFCLASFYDFERRGLAYLFDAYEKAKELLSKKYYPMNVYNKKVKAYAVKQVYEELIPALREKGYEKKEDILQKYYQEEEDIFRIISETKGPNRDRALFSWGRLYWDRQDYDKALEKWKQIGESFSSEVFDDIREKLESSMPKESLIFWIDKIFAKESYHENKKILERILQYQRWEKRSSSHS